MRTYSQTTQFHEQWEQKMQELKGKDYTFGVSGEVIFWFGTHALTSSSGCGSVGIRIVRIL